MTSFAPGLLWLIACGGDPAAEPTGTAPGTTVTPEDPPSPYIYDEQTVPEATVALSEVEAALQAALDLVMTVNAKPVEAAYTSAMTGATGACPYVYTTPDGSYWYDSCTAITGTEFDGYVFAYGADGVFDPYSGMTVDYWYAFGGATVVDGQGHTLEVGGGATVYKAYGNYAGLDLVSWYSQLQGTFAWDGPEAADTWMDAGIDPDLVISSTSVPSLGLSGVGLYGGFGGFLDGWAVAFDENVVGSPLLGMPCGEELSGTIGVRAPDGSWVDVRFDGAAEATDDFEPSECDGCGRAYFQGEEIGQVCVDVDTLLAMGVQPW